MKKFLSLRYLRGTIQTLSLLITLIVMYRYIVFVDTGIGRPDLVELFCPLGGFYSLIMWIRTGIFDMYHPAGMILIILGCLSSLILMKGFCGWLCPVGAVLDILTSIRNRTIGKYIDKIHIPKKLIFTIEGIFSILKYGVLFGFTYLLFRIPASMMPIMYKNSVLDEDIGLYRYWFNIIHGKDHISLIIFGIIILLSFIIPRFWCRYLCPLGALYGIFNAISILRLKRNDSTCEKCGLCTKNCPLGLKPNKSRFLNNFRCTSCLRCIENCPNKSLSLKLFGRFNLNPLFYPILLIGLYAIAILAASALGHWHSRIPKRVQAQMMYSHGIVKPWVRKELTFN